MFVLRWKREYSGSIADTYFTGVTNHSTSVLSRAAVYYSLDDAKSHVYNTVFLGHKKFHEYFDVVEVELILKKV